MRRVKQFGRNRIMKNFIALAIVSLIAATAAGGVAEAKGRKSLFLLDMPDGKKDYRKTCLDSGICGNWNVSG
jgi:hypothetical protein